MKPVRPDATPDALTWAKRDLGVGKRGVSYDSACGRFSIAPNYKDMKGYTLYSHGRYVSGHSTLRDAKRAAEKKAGESQ